MNLRINPSNLNGSITPPPSKSITQRVYAAALLNKGKTIIQNAGSSLDETAALSIIQALGAKADCISDDTLIITSQGINPITTEINCGESGLAARLFIPIVATTDTHITTKGEGSLLTRPMSSHINILSKLGLTVSSNNECLPLTIKGPLQPKDITIDGSLSSQFLSGLLLAYSFTSTEETIIQVTNLVSQPYVDLTLQTLKYFGKEVVNNDYQNFSIPSIQIENDSSIFYYIENDWSAAAALLIAGAITEKVVVDNILKTSLQADRAIIDVLIQIGAKVDISDYSISVEKKELNAFSFDATNSPDLFPVLSILAAACDGISTIKGTNRLIYKESNRLESIIDMLTNFGIEHKHADNNLIITGGKGIKSAIINSHNDHRIVMAAAIGGLIANGKVTIEGVDAVNKSYPDFFAHLSLLGADIEQL